MMDSLTAENLLRSAVLGEDGTYTILRSGRDPGKKRTDELVDALRSLQEKYAASISVPRETAYLCASIIHFAREARENGVNVGQSSADTVMALDIIVQAAFAIFENG